MTVSTRPDHRELLALRSLRRGLQAVARAGNLLPGAPSLQALSAMALDLMLALPFCEGGALAAVDGTNPRAGSWADRVASVGAFSLDPAGRGDAWAAIESACAAPDTLVRAGRTYAGARRIADGLSGVICLQARHELDADERSVLELFARCVANAGDTVLRRLESAAPAHPGEPSERPSTLFNDALTGLRSREQFRAALDETVGRGSAQQRPVGLVLIDIDQFQQINDNYGHCGGDEAIRAIGRRLGYMVRPGDVLARMGGDEFGVLAMSLDGAHELPGLVERLRNGLAKPMTIGAMAWHPSCSFGVAMFPRDAGGGEDLLRCAELAMVRAKRDGAGTVSYYDGEAHLALRRRAGVAMQLREALERGALSVHYQPLVRLVDRAIVGAEALVRVSLPDGRWLPPADFIPVAEEIGLIDEVGDRVLARALADVHGWHRAGHPELRLAVNLSGRQLRDAALAGRVAKALAATGFRADRLALELTESVLIGDAGGALQRLWELRELGLSLSIDDFGTGYSSLAYLRRLPVSTLKIDRSFVADLKESAEALHIVDTVVSLARSLRLAVVAEGVESEDQARMLSRLGCDCAQGYWFSKPVPAPEFARLLRRCG